jgi:hypothetical protein
MGNCIEELIKMNKYKMLDLVQASNEEMEDVVLSDILPTVVKEYGEYIVGEGVATLAGEVIGAVCPRINNIRLSYKQNRMERNINRMFLKITEKQNEIEERLLVLESREDTHSYLTMLSELLLDQIVDEIQKSKVDYNVNGYINLIKSNNTNEDLAIMFFKTLSQLSDLDIRVLNIYSYDSHETIHDIISESNIEYNQLKYVKEKLERFGLLQSKNDEINDNNLEQIVKYLQEVEKEKKKSKPKDVKLPNLKKISSSDTYKITPLGNNYIRLLQE